MSFVCIRNPGVANYKSFYLLGASTTRHSGNKDAIGMFGSGTKYGIAALLRDNLPVHVYCGLTHLNFRTEPERIDDGLGVVRDFQTVLVDITGKDENDKPVNKTVKTTQTLDHGVFDWTSIMGCREFVSNAIDVCTRQNLNPRQNVEISFVDTPRAKNGYTQVFIPVNDVVKAYINNISEFFLHFRPDFDVKRAILQKDKPSTLKIYKKGVFVRSNANQNSIFDYNLNALTLDESRNSSDTGYYYDALKAINDSKSLDVYSELLAKLHKHKTDVVESCFHLDRFGWLLKNNRELWKEAFIDTFGPRSVLCPDEIGLINFVNNKGMKSITLPGAWYDALRHIVPSLVSEFSETLCGNREVLLPTENICQCFNRVWELAVAYNMTHGVEKPAIFGYKEMQGQEEATYGIYDSNKRRILIREDLEGRVMFNTCVHELCHHITQADDNTREFANWLTLFITNIAY